MHGLIYKIINDVNNYCYIGQTICSINHRWNEHKQCVNNLNLSNKLYSAMREIGITHFSIQLIEEFEEISLEELDKREQYWINYYDSFYNGYNSTKGGQFGSRNIKNILCYTLSGKFYKSYKTVQEASNELNISYEAIINCLCSSSQQSCGGFQWKYEESDKQIINCQQLSNLNGKKLYFIQYDLQGKYINHYLGVEEASLQTGCLMSGIARCANGQIQHCGNYIWRHGFRGEEIPKEINIKPIIGLGKGKNKKVIYIKQNGEKITYNSLSEASRQSGYSRNKITYNCEIYPRSTLKEGWFKYEKES